MLTVKIDCALIDKARLFTGKPAQDGHTPKYLDLVLIPRREVGRYGETHIVKQSCSKEERLAKVEMPIIGSATERDMAPPKSAVSTQAPATKPSYEDDVPF
jgi:hypothetical protein